MAAVNAISATNVAVATEPGPIVSFNVPVTATFFSNGAPAVVDMVGLTLTGTSGRSRLKAFDQNGSLLGSIFAEPGLTSQISYPGQIHSVELDQGNFAFDDFVFTGLAAAPPPVMLNATHSGSNMVLSWTKGTLQAADTPGGTYADVTPANSPFTVAPSAERKFYRLRGPW